MKRRFFTAMVTAAILAVALLFALSACGRSNQDPARDETAGETTRETGVITAGAAHIPAGATLTISTPIGNLSRLQESADAFQASLAAQGVNITVNLQYYVQDDWHLQQDLLLSQFAAGVGPDIFVRDNMLLYPFVENGFIADIYTLIDQSASFSRQDFFTNVLDGIAVDGQLYMLPMNFGIDYIGINANAPPDFIERFEALDRASPTDIAALYLDLTAQYPQWADYALIHGLMATQAFEPALNHAVDFANRTANITTQTTDLLEYIRAAFAGNQRFDSPPFFNWQSPVEDLTLMQERYVFSRASGAAAGLYGLFEFSDPFFVHHVPLADENGHLVNRAWGVEMVVNRAANPDLVMGFIDQYMSDTITGIGRFGLDIPILREHVEQALESSFNHMLTQATLPPLAQGEGAAIRQAMARMETYSAWPSTTLITNYLVPQWELMGALPQFFFADATVYEATEQMAADINAWFNAERPAIAPFSPIETPSDIQDLPVRTLTIRNDNRHTGVIMQAAEAMNADWQARGVPYIFEVEIEGHNWTDWEGAEARATRLQTELMAGQGPDIFMSDLINVPWLEGAVMDFHALANSGFIRDIYTLMDADPNTSRDEFFTQALEAFELNNGLFMFPVSFGFEYIAINTDLPQGFVDRFAQKSSISLSEMMAFYLDLMDAYGDEFGHLTFQTGSGITFSSSVLQTTMGGFVDFNTRTSYLTDPAFIEALERIGVIYADWDVPNIWGTTINTPSFLQERAQEYVFFSIIDGLNNFDTFFTEVTPVFTHHIPLVDDHGRFMLNTPGAAGQVWTGICITTAGDGPLAWEFVRHMIDAYTHPIGRAAVEPVFGVENTWGNQSFATPIMRSLFRNHAMNTFETTFDRFGSQMQRFVGFDDGANRMAQFEAAIDRIAAYNEQPMGMLSPMIPSSLFSDHFDQFLRGLINAETAAQRMQNAISLWLIE